MKRTLTGLWVLAVAAGLVGCSDQSARSQAEVPPPLALAEWNHWVCDNRTELYWRPADADYNQLDVRLGGSDIVHRLDRAPAASGALYKNAVLAFHSKADEGFLYQPYDGKTIADNCRAR